MASQILIVMIAAIVVTIFAERRNIQAPLLLAMVGLGASYIPVLPRLELEPHVIVSVVLPPLLYTAAAEFSFFSFIRRLGSITNLGVILVLVTTVAVAGIASSIVPGMTFATAMVLAAVVSPPDAVTAVAIGGQLGLPNRIMTVLKGESLINDAAALTLFAFATASVTGATLLISGPFWYLLYSAVAGTVIGLIIGGIVHRARLKLHNASLITVLSVIVPFTAFLLAEEIGASGVLAVVAAGFSMGHNATGVAPEARMQERQFWRTTTALLEAFVFAYIGLQMRFVIEDVQAAGYPLPEVLGISLLVLLAVILVRIVWVFATGAFSRWRYPFVQARYARITEAERRRRPIVAPFSWQENLVIAWTGMRGVVTLAAAAGIPATTLAGADFPLRDVMQLVAFVVTIGTLLLQGLTLPWLIKTLKISDPNEVKARATQHKLAEDLSRQANIDVVTAYRDRQTDPQARLFADRMLQRFSAGTGGPAQSTPMANKGDDMRDLAQAMVNGRRAALVKARDEMRLDDEIMREVLEQLDLEQAVLTNWSSDRG